MVSLIHDHLKSNGFTKATLPALLVFSGRGGQCAETHLLVDIFGKGVLQICIRMHIVGDGPPETARYVLQGSDGGVVATTTHLVTRRLCRNVQAACADNRQYVFRMKCLSFIGGGGAEFCLKANGVEFDVTLNSASKRAPVKAVSSLPFGLELGNDVWKEDVVKFKGKDIAALNSESDDDKHSDDLLDSESNAMDDELDDGPPPPKLPPAGILGAVIDHPGQARCFFRKDKIKRDEVRYDYRLVSSASLRDMRRMHAKCASDIPDEMVDACLSTLAVIYDRIDIGDAVRAQVAETLFDLTNR
jgi:hypothetical protein